MLRRRANINHRHDRRERTTLQAVLFNGWRVQILNLSLGGAFFRCPYDDFFPGSVVDLAVILPNGPLGIRGIIRRQEATSYGIQCLSFEPGGFERLERHLLHRGTAAA